MESSHNNKESISKISSATEAAEKLISKKQAEKADEGMRAVQESAQGVQSEVADLMGGMEAPSEKISEKKGESGEKGDISATGGQTQDDDSVGQETAYSALRRGLPREEIMIKKIRTAINGQIELEMKRAMKLQKNLSTGSAQEYNTSIARIRRLKETLSSLATSAYEVVKGMYFKYFGMDGRRKVVED